MFIEPLPPSRRFRLSDDQVPREYRHLTPPGDEQMYQFRLSDDQVPREYRHLTPLNNEQPVGIGFMRFELMLNAFMLGGTFGSLLMVFIAPNVTGFIIGIILCGILAMLVLWEPTNRMLERAQNDPEERKRIQKRLDSIDDFG